MSNKSFILLIAFTGLMAATYSMAKTYTPERVTISLPNPPAPLPDPPETMAALPSISDLALQMSPTTEE